MTRISARFLAPASDTRLSCGHSARRRGHLPERPWQPPAGTRPAIPSRRQPTPPGPKKPLRAIFKFDGPGGGMLARAFLQELVDPGSGRRIVQAEQVRLVRDLPVHHVIGMRLEVYELPR